jgi:hypothetical protein
MTVTFAGVTLTRPNVTSIQIKGHYEETELNLGGYYVDAGTVGTTEIIIKCTTTSYTDITNIKAKIGTNNGVGYDLVLGATTFSNMMIKPPIVVTPSPDYTRWEYTLTFTEDTRV